MPATPAARSLLWVVAAVTAALSAFAPWIKSGRVTRSGFGVARTADRLDLLDGALQQLLLIAWFGLPLAAAIAVTAFARARPAISAVAALYCGVLVLTVVVIVSRSPLDTLWGLSLGAGAAGTTLAVLAVDGTRWLLVRNGAR